MLCFVILVLRTTFLATIGEILITRLSYIKIGREIFKTKIQFIQLFDIVLSSQGCVISGLSNFVTDILEIFSLCTCTGQ